MTDTATERTIEQLATRMVELHIDQLRPHPDNPNIGNSDAIGTSLAVNGYVVPIICQAPRGRRKYYRIIDGQHRWEQLKAQGETSVHVVPLDIDDAHALRLLATINPIARQGHDDPAKALALLNGLIDSSLGLAGTGYTQADHDALMAQAVAAAKLAAPDLDDDTFRRGLSERAADYEGMATRQMVLALGRTQYGWLVQVMAQLREDLNLDSTAEVVLHLAAAAIGDDVPT